MEQKTKADNDLIQVGLRLTNERNRTIESKARQIGISKNALIQVLIEYGLKIFDGELNIIPRPQV